MAGFEKDIFSNSNYVRITKGPTYITLYVSTEVSEIFDNPGANWFAVSCNGISTDILRTGRYIEFNNLSPNTTYTIIIDVMYEAGYGGNYGSDKTTVTTEQVFRPTLTLKHYRGATLYTTTTHTFDYGATISNVSTYSISIPGYPYQMATLVSDKTLEITGSFSITSNMTIYMWYGVPEIYNVTIRHYLQNADGSFSSSIDKTTIHQVEKGREFTFANQDYGYNSMTYVSGQASTNNSFSNSIINVKVLSNGTYYMRHDRTRYKIDIYPGQNITSQRDSFTARWGEQVELWAIVETGYVFDSWRRSSIGEDYVFVSSDWVYSFEVPTRDLRFWPTAIKIGDIPTVFQWTVPKTMGSNYISKSEWIGLQAFVKSKKPNANFTIVPSTGQPLTAALFNEMAVAVGYIGKTNMRVGDVIYHGYLNELVRLANLL